MRIEINLINCLKIFFIFHCVVVVQLFMHMKNIHCHLCRRCRFACRCCYCYYCHWYGIACVENRISVTNSKLYSCICSMNESHCFLLHLVTKKKSPTHTHTSTGERIICLLIWMCIWHWMGGIGICHGFCRLRIFLFLLREFAFSDTIWKKIYVLSLSHSFTFFSQLACPFFIFWIPFPDLQYCCVRTVHCSVVFLQIHC